MTKDIALQTLAAIINRAVFSGTLVEVSNIGQQAQEALEFLAKPVVETKTKKWYGELWG